MFPVKFDPNPNILLNQIQQETNLNKDQIVPAVSFIEMIQKLSKSAKEQDKKDAEIQKEIESKIQSEIKSGTKLDLNLMNLIANKVMSDEIKKVNDSIKMQQARKAYGDYSMKEIKSPIRFRNNFSNTVENLKDRILDKYPNTFKTALNHRDYEDNLVGFHLISKSGYAMDIYPSIHSKPDYSIIYDEGKFKVSDHESMPEILKSEDELYDWLDSHNV